MVRTTHSIEFKSRVIHTYLNTSPKVSLGHMERVTQIKRQVISGWLKNKVSIQAQQGKRSRTRLPNKNQKCLCPAMEVKLKDWIITNRNLGACIDGTLIKSKAKEFYLEINPVPDETDQPEQPAYVTFSASCSWMNLFELCGIHEHRYINGELCVRFDNLHSMLKMFVQHKVTTLFKINFTL